MATVTGTVTVPLASGVREDLSNTISTLSPDETPLFSNAKKTKAKAINHEWQTDTLEASTINARLEGDTITVATAVSTVRMGNIMQISEKDYGVSGTLQSVHLAGRESELVRLRMKKGLELRRDMEVVLHTNQAKRADSGSTVRLSAGLPTWITNNVGVDVSQGNGDGSSAIRSSGTTALTYDYLASAHQLAFEDGGAPSILEVPPGLKRKFSQLAFSATPSTADVRYEAKAHSPAVAIGTVDKWLSDFGSVDVVVNRQLAIQASTFLKQAAFLIDPKHLSVAMLRNFEIHKLAKTGDATAEYVVSEYTLAPDAPSAHAAAYGMT
jgi:hypothetical protein